MVNRRQTLALVPLLTALLSLLAEIRYRRLPRLPAQKTSRPLPSLTIIVPARDEETNLCRLLPSLLTSAYPGPVEVIVVDDDSSDASAAVAEEHGVRLIRLTDLPEGWLGKPFACHQGAVAASGEWLLFTDADTFHRPHGLAQAVAYAQDNGLDGLSLWLQQESGGWLDASVMPVAFAGLFAGVTSVNELMNGQYILLRREAYLSSGGFMAVSDEPVEDLALGHHLCAAGYRVQTLRGESAASVRMYRDAPGLWHGLTRLGGRSLRWLGPSSLLTMLLVAATITPITLIASALGRAADRPIGSRLRQALLIWAATVPSFLPWARRLGSGWWALLAPLGALIVQLAATWGLVSQLIGRGIRWRGRVVR